MAAPRSLPLLHNLGSINLDHVYRVPHLVTPGETLASHGYEVGLGGKGANQSLALARAGGRVCHWGRLGRQDAWARDTLARAGVDVSHLSLVDAPSGHAIIQVDDAGENAIILYPGANHGFGEADFQALVDAAAPGDWLLLQNECNGLAQLLALAAERQIRVAFNPAPMTDAVGELPLSACRLLFVNRTEAAGLAGLPVDSPPDALPERGPNRCRSWCHRTGWRGNPHPAGRAQLPSCPDPLLRFGSLGRQDLVVGRHRGCSGGCCHRRPVRH